jgi:hypothetical protein
MYQVCLFKLFLISKFNEQLSLSSFSLGKLLSKEELHRRRRNCYKFPYTIELQKVHYQSNLADFYQHHYVNLMDRLKIDAIILDCNYSRLRYCLNLFADERIRRLRASFYEVQLPENERPMIMEFFLQIDGI